MTKLWGKIQMTCEKLFFAKKLLLVIVTLHHVWRGESTVTSIQSFSGLIRLCVKAVLEGKRDIYHLITCKNPANKISKSLVPYNFTNRRWPVLARA